LLYVYIYMLILTFFPTLPVFTGGRDLSTDTASPVVAPEFMLGFDRTATASHIGHGSAAAHS
jgi:hypothetical protein